MFDSLDQQIKRDEARGEGRFERLMTYGFIALLSLLVFGGLYMLIRLVH